MVNCKNCDKEFIQNRFKKKFCSLKCYHEYRSNHMNEYPIGNKGKPYKCKNREDRVNKISQTMKSKNYKGKTIQERYGLTDNEYAEYIENCIKRQKGKTPLNKLPREIRCCLCGCGSKFEVSIKNRKKFISGHNNKDKKFGNRSEETKIKMRLAVIKRIEEHFGKAIPNYNLKACEFFKTFDERNDTKGYYGANEHFIKNLGYFPDYINFDKKLIIEWDEKRHYDCKGNLREKDRIRQEQIQKTFPDFEFRRINEVLLVN